LNNTNKAFGGTFAFLQTHKAKQKKQKSHQANVPKTLQTMDRTITTDKRPACNKVHISGRGSVVRQLRPDSYRDAHRSSLSFGQERSYITTVRLSKIWAALGNIRIRDFGELQIFNSLKFKAC
jgi:hypothetical protein